MSPPLLILFIGVLGRWKSICYQLYTRVAGAQVLDTSRLVGRSGDDAAAQQQFAHGQVEGMSSRWSPGDALYHQLPQLLLKVGFHRPVFLPLLFPTLV